MNKQITLGQTSLTASACAVLSGMLVTSYGIAGAIQPTVTPSLYEKPYQDIQQLSPSFSQFDLISDQQIARQSDVDEFFHEISTVYCELANEQEALGDEFQQVLYDNQWDLYEE